MLDFRDEGVFPEMSKLLWEMMICTVKLRLHNCKQQAVDANEKTEQPVSAVIRERYSLGTSPRLGARLGLLGSFPSCC